MKIFKKTISVMLALCMTLSVATVAFADEENSGQCGDNLAWMYEDETLTIEGSGRMYDYGSYGDSRSPWTGLTVKTVIIKSDVTYIGNYAFNMLGASSGTGIEIYFEGDAPEFGTDWVYDVYNATAYYTENNNTWTEEVIAQAQSVAHTCAVYFETYVNKNELEKEITYVIEDLYESDYTSESWTALQNALSKAQEVLDTEDATQDEVDAALTELTQAVDALKPAQDSGTTGTTGDDGEPELTVYVNASSDEERPEGEARPGDTVTVSYTLAGPIVNMTSFVTDVIVPVGMNFKGLSNPTTMMILVPSKMFGENAYYGPVGYSNGDTMFSGGGGRFNLASGDEFLLFNASYTVSDYATAGNVTFGFTDETYFEYAHNVKLGIDEINVVTQPLEIVVVNTTVLENTIISAQSTLSTENEYTEKSLAYLQAAVDDAQAILDDIDDYYQEDVDDALAALKDAQARVLKIDTWEELEKKVQEAREADSDNYTDEAWDTLQTVLKAAEDLLDEEYPLQEDVENMVESLTQALEATISGEEENPDGGLSSESGNDGNNNISSATPSSGTATSGGTLTTSPQTGMGSGFTLCIIALGFVLSGFAALIIYKYRFFGKKDRNT